MTTSDNSIIVTGGTASMALVFFRDALDLAFPFLIVAIVVVLVDLYFGVRAAKHRGEQVRATTAARKTTCKIVEYVSWVILAATLAVAFETPNLSRIILAFVIFIESISIIGNWLELRGKKISGLDAFGLKILEDKTHHDTSMIKIEDTKKNGTDNTKGV